MSPSTRPTRAASCAALILAASLAGSALAQQAAKPAPAPSAGAAANGQQGSPDQLFTQWDADKNGQLSRKEFNQGWEQAREASLIGRLEAQFKSMDADRNGVLDEKEYGNLPMIKRTGPGGPRLAVFDTDKSGKLDFREYLIMVQTMIKRSESAAP